MLMICRDNEGNTDYARPESMSLKDDANVQPEES